MWIGTPCKSLSLIGIYNWGFMILSDFLANTVLKTILLKMNYFLNKMEKENTFLNTLQKRIKLLLLK